jgi:hypothetical protein
VPELHLPVYVQHLLHLRVELRVAPLQIIRNLVRLHGLRALPLSKLMHLITGAAAECLELISAVVVGAIVDLTLFLGKAAIVPSGVVGVKQLNAISLAGVMLSLLLLQRFKLKIIHVILLGIGVWFYPVFPGFLMAI